MECATAKTCARKFVSYWNNRRAIYGEDNAFLPLHLIHGSLTKECTPLLRSTMIQILPHDQKGRAVVFLNLSMRDVFPREQVLHANRLRCIFYMLQVLSEDEASRKGCVLLISYEESFYEAISILLWLENVLPCFPFRLTEIHIVLGETKNLTDVYLGFIPISMKLLLSPDKGDPCAYQQCHHIHQGRTVESIVKGLEQFGLTRESIPTLLGGDWSAANQCSWIEARMKEENRRRSLPLEDSEALSFPGREETSKESLTAEERAKVQCILSSRLKIQRNHCKRRALEHLYCHLKEQQKQLQETNKDLQTCLKEAQRLVAGYGTTYNNNHGQALVAPQVNPYLQQTEPASDLQTFESIHLLQVAAPTPPGSTDHFGYQNANLLMILVQPQAPGYAAVPFSDDTEYGAIYHVPQSAPSQLWYPLMPSITVPTQVPTDPHGVHSNYIYSDHTVVRNVPTESQSPSMTPCHHQQPDNSFFVMAVLPSAQSDTGVQAQQANCVYAQRPIVLSGPSTSGISSYPCPLDGQSICVTMPNEPLPTLPTPQTLCSPSIQAYDLSSYLQPGRSCW
eukprot:scaffold9322_cov168-Amphora_coffeaeformis.AAC.7